MSYYKVLNLDKEPFSTSPDPDFFYHSLSHETALKRLEIAIRLRRGLSLILGDVGTGKTTLSRMLLNTFKDDDDFIFHIILDPGHKSEYKFLLSLIKILGIQAPFRSTLDFKEALERYLFQAAASEGKTIIVLIDEGQKITQDNLEILRMLLNYETNECKLLQLVIMAQIELLGRIKRTRNFIDRIALKYTINPLDERETKEMVNFRLRQAGFKGQGSLFTDEALRLIYKYTQGYPRQIAMLSHDALETIVMRNRPLVDALIVDELIRRRS